MELFSPQFFSALLAIIIIDLVLAGDNAIVIALAARKLPQHLQMRAVIWGTAGAIAVRVAMTLVVVALLRIPGLMLAGGILLIWIAYKLLASDDGEGAHVGAAPVTSFWSAIRTIIIADAVMGLDNVLGVAGAAQGSFLLVVLGLLISIPIMVWGSRLILKLVDRYPSIVYIGAGVLAWTSAKMILHEPLIASRIQDHAWVKWVVDAVIIGGVLGAGWLRNRRKKPAGIVLPEHAEAPPPSTDADPGHQFGASGQSGAAEQRAGSRNPGESA
ncbi:MAG: TerC family protein [Burkholderiales bacterium]|nr:TerC family protein [Burkholderiales bacterium]